MFYIPYFSHYGQKAPRKPGFLTPSFDILSFHTGEFNVTTPYYLPLNDQADITFTPTLFPSSSDKLNLITDYSLLSGSGSTNIVLNDIPVTASDTFTFNVERIILEADDRITFVGANPTNLSVTISYLEV